MTYRFAVRSLLAPCLIAALFFSTLFARDEAPSNWKTLETNYAQANLALAKARLALADHENQAIAESVPTDTIKSLQAGVQLAQDQLRQLESGDVANPYAARIAAAEIALQGIEANYNEALGANKRQPGTVSELELRREAAEIEVAKTQLAALRALAQQPFEVRIQWEIRQLQDQVRALWARPLIED